MDSHDGATGAKGDGMAATFRGGVARGSAELAALIDEMGAAWAAPEDFVCSPIPGGCEVAIELGRSADVLDHMMQEAYDTGSAGGVALGPPDARGQVQVLRPGASGIEGNRLPWPLSAKRLSLALGSAGMGACAGSSRADGERKSLGFVWRWRADGPSGGLGFCAIRAERHCEALGEKAAQVWAMAEAALISDHSGGPAGAPSAVRKGL